MRAEDSGARARFHLERAVGLLKALETIASVETLAPLRPATMLFTSLRVMREELALAQLALTPARPPLRREAATSLSVHDGKGVPYGSR
jgi:hypothetical protein